MGENIKLAKNIFEIEIQALEFVKNKIDVSFDKAIEQLMGSKGKVITTGMGKSGIIAKKMASTLSSTGTAAVFLHPAESSHGDLGIIDEKDVVIALSYGGGSDELNPLLRFVKRKGIPLISLTGNTESKLAEYSDVTIDISVEKEACPLNLAPTASSTATLAMCDAIAMVLLENKGFKEEDFAQYHPGGNLGRRLLTRVKDIIPTYSSLPLVSANEKAQEVLNIMTTKEVRGICGVVDNNKKLIGAVTDGDIRRWINKVFEDPNQKLNATAQDLMSSGPKVIFEEELAQKALFMMEQFSISSLFVLSKNSKDEFVPTGILHIQDLLDAKIT